METSQQGHPVDEAVLVDLIERAQRHADPDAFDLLYTLFADRIFRYTMTHCGDFTRAEEITADVFLHLIEKINRYRITPKDNVAIFSAWLYRMAFNEFVSDAKSLRQEPFRQESSRQERSAMSSKLDRFTKHARRALTLAQEEALRLNHDYIGPEHLLLGLVRAENSTAAKVLHALRVESGQVIRGVERAVARGERAPAAKPTLAPQSKRVIELSVDEARLMGNYYIGTEHMLLGLLREGGNVAVQVFRGLGINLDLVRTQTARMILQEQGEVNERRKPVRSPQVERMTVDLTAAAEAGTLDPLIGRQRDLDRLIQVLCRRTKGSALLVGEPGVGKQALLRGLAQRMVEGRVPAPLLNRRLLMLDLSFLMPGRFSPSVEEWIQPVLDECIATGAILCIDNLHTWVSAVNSGVGVAHQVKSALNRGTLHVIGITTPGSYDNSFGTEVAHDWHLQPVPLDEPSSEETLAILRGIKGLHEHHHRLVIAEEALQAAVALSVRYVTDRFLPDKAIDLIDEAGSRVRMERAPNADELRRVFLEWKRAAKEKEAALEGQRFDDAIELRRQEVELEARFNELREGEGDSDAPLTVTPQDIAEVVALWTGVAASQIAQDKERPNDTATDTDEEGE